MTVEPTHVYVPSVRSSSPRHRAELLAGAFIASYRAETTRRSYAADLKHWFGFLEQHHVNDPLGPDVTRSHGDVYQRLMEQRGLSTATVFRRTGTVCTWYQWLTDEEHLDRSPLRNLKRTAPQRHVPRAYLSRTELCDWLNAAQADGGHAYALACLLALNGLRIGETCAINVQDVTMFDHHHTLILPNRKGGKKERVALAPRTMHAIEQIRGDRQIGPLLLTRYGSRMNREAAGRIVDRYARRVGVTRRITPHALRRSAITALLNSGAGVRDVADFAGHEDIKTTAGYDQDRFSLNRHGTYALSQYVAGAA